jgi:tetratricopeptide (TPR) repeat protein
MFVVHLAIASHHPQLVELVRSFALGKSGTFEERMNVAQLLNQAGLLPSGMVRLWRNGAWEESLLLNMEISAEPVPGERLPKAVERLHMEGVEAMHAGDGPRAVSILQEAVALLPDNPHLLNNLAIAYQLQGELEKARQMLREIHGRFPDYFLGTVAAARLAMGEGELDQARDLLTGLMQREKLHVSEFRSLCAAQIELLMKEGQQEAARSWLGMWGGIDPYQPALSAYRRWVESGEGAPPSLPLYL